jgi:hypothetical protein
LYANSLLPGPGDFITGALQALVEDYSANLEFDVEWAMDLALPDDDHSRLDNSWIWLALGRGLYNAFEIGFGDYTVNPLDLFASASGKASKGKGGASGKARGGYTIYVQNGQRAHNTYRTLFNPDEYQFEFNIKGGRVDAIDVKNKILRELKPDTPSGRAAGARALKRYAAELARDSRAHVKGVYRLELDLYRP